MLATQPTRIRRSTMSSKEALRAHVDQLSPAQQREFIAAALGLIATRTMLDEVEVSIYRSQSQATNNINIH